MIGNAIRGYSGQFIRQNEQAGLVYRINGGLLFIGIFLGALFLVATILIIYYNSFPRA